MRIDGILAERRPVFSFEFFTPKTSTELVAVSAVAVTRNLFFAADGESGPLLGYAIESLPGLRYAGKGDAHTVCSGNGLLTFRAREGRITVTDTLTQTVLAEYEAWRHTPDTAVTSALASPDGSRPGVYYAHLSDMNSMPKTELEVIAYHEGLPGHHMQISIAQELEDVPTFRTQQFTTAYTEGWGLYSEWLAKEMDGTYQTPYSEYGRLMSEMWRAIRLVVDTGMHAKGWTEQQAVDYFRANSSVPDAAIRSEVQRYLVYPGQATAYKVGMIRIQQLRADAEAELGEAFDIRGFHDTLLGGGAMPLDLLERRVDGWIAEQKTTA